MSHRKRKKQYENGGNKITKEITQEKFLELNAIIR